MTIAADPKHLGARIGITAVLHTWGSAMTHHPHIHMIVPGGGISLDGRRWISSRPAFLLPVRVLGALFRRLFLTRLIELHRAGRLAFFGTQAGLADHRLLPASSRSGQEEAMGGLCQAAVHRPRGRARLSLALHPPGRHLEPAPDCVRRDRRHLPLQGLPPRWSGAAARHDARAARVHPPLPAPCPATWLPPHPPLRPARQFRTQGQYRACPRTACRGTAAGACRSARTTRLAPALSLLRRPHDHHRDLRAMAATTRATSRARTNREHARRDPARLALTSRRNTTVAANAPECALRQDQRKAAVSQPQQVPKPPSARRRISRTKPPPTAEPSRLRNHSNRAKHEIPIDHHRNPAGSCLGGFPTPDGIRKPSPSRPLRRSWPFLESGHHVGG